MYPVSYGIAFRETSNLELLTRSGALLARNYPTSCIYVEVAALRSGEVGVELRKKEAVTSS
jgi:hypothetical protein